MKVMMFMKMSEGSQNPAPPTEEAMLAMHNYNEALIAAGILNQQAYGGLLPTSFAKRLQYRGKNLTVIDGPFTESKEVIGGFALWEVKSMDEALEWARKCPVMMDCDAEIRPLYSPEFFDPK
ncbi:MAG: YciI family protein [Pseudomonadota bacterium]